MKVALLFALFIFLPTFVNALKCNEGGVCYTFGYPQLAFTEFESKECDGACYAFYHLTDLGYVLKGAGCYEEFDSVSGWIRPDLKLEAKGKNNYEHFDENVVVVSCDSSSDCASKKIGEYFNKNAIATFGKDHVPRSENEVCHYVFFWTKMSYLPEYECHTFGVCESYEGFVNFSRKRVTPDDFDSIASHFKKEIFEKNKKGCVEFACVSDEKRVMYGAGSFEEFDRVCTNVPADVKQNVKDKKDDYFYEDENTMVVTCTGEDDCTQTYFKNYRKNFRPEVFGSKVDKSFHEKCTYGPKTTTESPTTTTTPKPTPNVPTTVKQSRNVSKTSQQTPILLNTVQQQNPNGPSTPKQSESIPTTSQETPDISTTPKQTPNSDSNEAKSFKISGMLLFGFLLFYLW